MNVLKVIAETLRSNLIRYQRFYFFYRRDDFFFTYDLFQNDPRVMFKITCQIFYAKAIFISLMYIHRLIFYKFV